jgi:hypothetical protein
MEFATARYPIIEIKLAMVEAMKGSESLDYVSL